MKIAIASDLHLEFGTISLENTESAEVLILSGDICVASDLLERDVYEIRFDDKSSKIHKFFEECCAKFPYVIYIAGNHEHYHGDYLTTHSIIRARLHYLKNLFFLEKELIELNGVCFAGGTLWTDMNKEDPTTIFNIKGVMNDFRIISNGQNRFLPEDTVEDHKAMLKFIDESIASRLDMPWVVVGHHSPSKLSTHPRYEKEVIINGAYSSDLSDFILDRPQIKLWTHGHTHYEFDYMIGGTRIVCNPRGYIHYEDRADEFELKFVEI